MGEKQKQHPVLDSVGDFFGEIFGDFLSCIAGDSFEGLVICFTIGLVIWVLYRTLRWIGLCIYRAAAGADQKPEIKASIEKKSQALRDIRDAVGSKASAMAPRSSRQVTITARR